MLYAMNEDKIGLLNYYMDNDMYNKIIAVIIYTYQSQNIN